MCRSSGSRSRPGPRSPWTAAPRTWTGSRPCRRIIEFTQRGHELNVVVTGINVGAQPSWNAEATMLMHTKGILVMTPASAVLTGEAVARLLGSACRPRTTRGSAATSGSWARTGRPSTGPRTWPAPARLLLSYEHSYVAPGERFPRRAETSDPFDRDAGEEPHHAPGSDLARVADIFSDSANPERKKPFDIRTVMRAALDKDHPPLERWSGMEDAEIAVVWDARTSAAGRCPRSASSRARCRATGRSQPTARTSGPRARSSRARRRRLPERSTQPAAGAR